MNIGIIKIGSVFACSAGCNPITSGMVGVTVTFEYTDPKWDGLNKTAVFTAGNVTRDVLDADGVVTIPAEVLEKPNVKLYAGVYGTDADGKLVIPTIMIPVGIILPGADPSGDPGTDPDLPIWAQLQAEVEALKQGGTGGGGSIIVDEDGYLTTTAGGFEIDDEGYIVL